MEIFERNRNITIILAAIFVIAATSVWIAIGGQSPGTKFVATQEVNYDFASMSDTPKERIYGDHLQYENTKYNVRGPYTVNEKNYYVASSVQTEEEIVFGESRPEIGLEKIQGMEGLYYEIIFDPLMYDSFEVEATSLNESYEEFMFESVKEGRSELEDTNFVAYRFLGNLTHTSRTVEGYVQSPSRRGAERVIRRYRDTLRAYDEDLADTMKVMNNTRHQNNREIKLVTGRIINSNSLIDFLKQHAKNIEELDTEIRRRKAVLNGDIEYNVLENNTFKSDEIKEYDVETFSESIVKRRFLELENESYNREMLNDANLTPSYRVPFSCFDEEVETYEDTAWLQRIDHEKAFDRYPSLTLSDKFTYAFERELDSIQDPDLDLQNPKRTLNVGENETEHLTYLGSMPTLMCWCPFGSKSGRIYFNSVDRVFKNFSKETFPKEEGEIYERFKNNPSKENLDIMGENYYNSMLEAIEKSRNGKDVDEKGYEYIREIAIHSKSYISGLNRPLRKVENHKDTIKIGWSNGTYYSGDGSIGLDPDSDLRQPIMSLNQMGFTLPHWSDSVWRLDEKADPYKVGYRQPLFRLSDRWFDLD